jgi:hypothetical protein
VICSLGEPLQPLPVHRLPSLIFVLLAAVMAIVLVRYQAHPIWILVGAALYGLGSVYVMEPVSAWWSRKLYGGELPEPFRAEVLLDGNVVAELTDRKVTEMFWRNYKITLTDGADPAVILDDLLWHECRFTFRDPLTGAVCNTGFIGSTPAVRDGRISLRGLDFKEPE